MSHHPHDSQQDDELLQHFRQHSQGEPSAAIDALILAAARDALAPQPAKPKSDWSHRLHAWLFGPGGRTRWSAAFASLAIVGIGLSLTWRTQEQAPALYDAPAPMAAQAPAPLAREMAPSVAESRKQSADIAAKKTEQSAVLAESVDASAAYSAAPRMTLQAPAAKPAPVPSVEALADAAGSPAEEMASAPDQAFAVAKEKAAATARSKAEAQAEATLAGRMQGQQKLAEDASLQQRLLTVLQLRRDGQHEAAERLFDELSKAYPQHDVGAELRLLEQQKPGSSR